MTPFLGQAHINSALLGNRILVHIRRTIHTKPGSVCIRYWSSLELSEEPMESDGIITPPTLIGELLLLMVISSY